MRRFFSAFATALAMLVLASGCAKERSTPKNEDEKRYFDAWISIHYPETEPTDLGVYIIEDEEGSGAVIDEASYLFVTYTRTTLDGTISSTNDMEKAQQLGEYDKSYYYGPAVWATEGNSLQAGVEDMISGMKVGGTRTAVIPGWLMTFNRRPDAEGYIANDSGTDAIYTIHVSDTTNNITKWQIRFIEKYLSEKYPGEQIDSVSYGFYYKTLKEGIADDEESEEDDEDSSHFPDDTTIYINYTGYLLNGQAFDTTLENTAKDNNIYSSSKTYQPVQIKWSSTASGIKMGSGDGNSIISGFSQTLWQMHDKEKGFGVFYSDLGYTSSGSGSVIPGYSPLLFEVEITNKP